MSLPRVDFYVSETAGAEARLRLACRIAEKVYLGGQTAVVLFDDPALLPKFDEMLWTFGDGTFVPHDVLQPGVAGETPVALTTAAMPAKQADVLINLGGAVPDGFEKYARVAEFLDARPEVRAAGRERFKVYRAKAIEPQTHNV